MLWGHVALHHVIGTNYTVVVFHRVWKMLVTFFWFYICTGVSRRVGLVSQGVIPLPDGRFQLWLKTTSRGGSEVRQCGYGNKIDY